MPEEIQTLFMDAESALGDVGIGSRTPDENIERGFKSMGAKKII